MPGIILENWTELPQTGPVEKYDLRTGKITASRVFRGPYSERFIFLQNILPQLTGTPDGIDFDRNYYFYPGIDGLLAHSAEITGHLVPSCDGPEGLIQYEAAEVTISYETDNRNFFLSSGVLGQAPPVEAGSPILKTNYQITSETKLLTVDGKEIKDAQNKRQQANGDQEIQVTLLNFMITYEEVLFPQWDSIFANIGKINGDILILQDFVGVLPIGGFEASHLLYDGPSAVTKTVVRSWNNAENKIEWDLAWNITHKLIYNPRHGWHQIPIGFRMLDDNGQPLPNGMEYTYKALRKYPSSTDNFAFLRRWEVAPEPLP